MTTCQTCKHWTEDLEYTEGICSQLTQGSPMESGYQNDHTLLIVREGFDQGTWGRMLTPPDFGCTLHEAKGEEE